MKKLLKQCYILFVLMIICVLTGFFICTTGTDNVFTGITIMGIGVFFALICLFTAVKIIRLKNEESENRLKRIEDELKMLKGLIHHTGRNYILTKKYYSEWLDTEPKQFDLKGVFLIKTEKRRICPKGHPKNLELYCVAFEDSMYISYSHELDNDIHFIECFKKDLNVSDGVIKLKELFGNRLIRRKAHYFTKLSKGIDTSKVIALRKKNYDDYLHFFITQHPNASTDGWLYDYFIEISEKDKCFGIYEDNILVCVANSPDIPYMEGIITEPGIDTLPDYRKKGYASAVCAKYLEVALSRNEVPVWTCAYDNAASYKLAEKLGFNWFCDLYTVEGEIGFL